MNDDNRMTCELCNTNPCRRADQEYRESHPDDPWMVLCDECDTKTKGASPARKQSGSAPNKDSLRAAAGLRLEYLAYQLKVDTAMAMTIMGRPEGIPESMQWIKDIKEPMLTRFSIDLTTIKAKYNPYVYTARFQKIAEGLQKYRDTIGTYQLMSGIGQFSGEKPKESAKSGTEVQG